MRYNKNVLFGGLLALSFAASPLQAAVSSSEAARLGQDLTPFGSPKAGNDAGTIPAWDGGLTEPPAGYEGSGQHHINPFPDDEVLFTITASNMDQYSEYLTDGVRAMLETYPTTFRIPVYQSRRTHAVPEWVAENTRKNAVNAEIVGEAEGIEGAFGGYPFPILHGNDEEKAWQVIWNHLTRWRGVSVTRRS
ncbi:DUF1329 domain-containing protein, partial [Marinobacter nauticus]